MTSARPLSGRGLRVLPWILLLVVVVSWVGGFYFDPQSNEVTAWADRLWGMSFFAFPVVGLFLALRIPNNAVGWLFILGPAFVGLGVSLVEFSEAKDAPWALGTGDVIFALGLIALGAALLLFPDGRYPWRIFVWAHLAAFATFAASATIGWGPGIDWGLTILILLPIAATGLRAFTGGPVLRRQLAWPGLVMVVGIATVALVGLLVEEGTWPTTLAFMLLTIGLPVSIAIAITKHRLYEIDRLVSRTISYVVVVGVLVGVYAALVALFQVFVPSNNPVIVAASTLAVAALFNPVRKRVLVWVDRRFNRSRYNAERVVDSFVVSLRDRVEVKDVVDGWVGVVAETMQPSAIRVWTRE